MYATVLTMASAIVATAQGRCVRSIRMAPLSDSTRLRGERRTHPTEEFVRLHAMRRIVRAGVYATRLGQIGAYGARSRLLLYHGHLAPRVHRIVLHHRERMHVDIAVRAVLRAQAAPDAP